MMRRKPSRRQVLLAGAALTTGGCFPEVGGQWPVLDDSCRDEAEPAPGGGESPVAQALGEDAVSVDPATQRTTVVAGPARQLLEAVLAALTSGATPWTALLPDWTPATRIGVKVNALNQQCPTSVVLVRALVDSLVDGLGAARDRIIVWDRRADELRQCGFTEEAVGAKVLGTIASVSSTSGPGYGDPTCGVVAGKAPRLSRILTELTDVTINVPVLKTHAICGVTGAMKNIYGVIDNPGDYHANIATALPQLYRLPPIRRSFRLHLLDALVAVTTGGTSSPADTVPKRLAASRDPVALDAYALALADRLRDEKRLGLAAVDRSVMGWMEGARALGLGSLTYALKG
jgi:uncharacterized protein (DUF362 family)